MVATDADVVVSQENLKQQMKDTSCLPAFNISAISTELARASVTQIHPSIRRRLSGSGVHERIMSEKAILKT